MIKKPLPGDGNATMQIDAVGDLEGIQLEDNEASDAPESMPPPSVGRHMPPPLPAFTAQPASPGAGGAAVPPQASSPAAKSPRNVLVYGVIFVVVAIGITAGVKLGSALRGPAPASSVPAAPATPSVTAASEAPAPAAAPSASVMRLDTIEVRDPPAGSK